MGNNWKQNFFKFFNHPWQEDVEIHLLETIAEYKNEIVKNEQAGKDYLNRLFKENEKILINNCSERFLTTYHDLIENPEESNNFGNEKLDFSNDKESTKEDLDTEGPDSKAQKDVDSIEAEAKEEEKEDGGEEKNNKNEQKSMKKESIKTKNRLLENPEVIFFQKEIDKILNYDWVNPGDKELVDAIKQNEDAIKQQPERGFNYVRRMRHANAFFITKRCSKEFKNMLDKALSEDGDSNGFDKDYNLWEAKKTKYVAKYSIEQGSTPVSDWTNSIKRAKIPGVVCKKHHSIYKHHEGLTIEVPSLQAAKMVLKALYSIGIDWPEISDFEKQEVLDEAYLTELGINDDNLMRIRAMKDEKEAKDKAKSKEKNMPKVRKKKDMSALIEKWEKYISVLEKKLEDVFAEQDLEAGDYQQKYGDNWNEKWEGEGMHNEYGEKLHQIEKQINHYKALIRKYSNEPKELTYDEVFRKLKENINHKSKKISENYLYFPTKTYCYLVQADYTFNPYSASTYSKMYFASEDTAKNFIENNKKGDLKYKGKVNENVLYEDHEPTAIEKMYMSDEWVDAQKNSEGIDDDYCPVCGKIVTIENSDTSGICNSCTEEGYWMDPAGGIHSPDEEDPAKIYESKSLKEGDGTENYFVDDTDWDYEPKKTSAYENLKTKYPELNWDEAEEVSDDDLKAASDMFDKINLKEGSSIDDFEEFETQEVSEYGERMEMDENLVYSLNKKIGKELKEQNIQKHPGKIALARLYNGIKNDYSIQHYTLSSQDVLKVIKSHLRRIPLEDKKVQFENKLITDVLEYLPKGTKTYETIAAFATELQMNIDTMNSNQDPRKR